MSNGVDPRIEASKEMFSVAWDGFVHSALTSMYVGNPWMNFFIVKWIIGAVAGKISSLIKDNVSLFVDVTAIKIYNHEAMIEYKKHSVMLAVVLNEKGKDSEEFKKAREAAAISMSRFTRVNQ